MADGSHPWVPNPIAVELGMNDVSWGATAAAPVTSRGERPDLDHLYQFLLNSIEKLFDGELEQNAFEDCARVAFGTEAYLLFTIDKLIGALVKQAKNHVRLIEVCIDVFYSCRLCYLKDWGGWFLSKSNARTRSPMLATVSGTVYGRRQCRMRMKMYTRLAYQSIGLRCRYDF